jgi:hypothetical protein
MAFLSLPFGSTICFGHSERGSRVEKYSPRELPEPFQGEVLYLSPGHCSLLSSGKTQTVPQNTFALPACEGSYKMGKRKTGRGKNPQTMLSNSVALYARYLSYSSHVFVRKSYDTYLKK